MNKPNCFICNKEISSPNYKDDEGLVVSYDIFAFPRAYHRKCAIFRGKFFLWALSRLIRRDFEKRKGWRSTALIPIVNNEEAFGWTIINSPSFKFISIFLTVIYLVFSGIVIIFATQGRSLTLILFFPMLFPGIVKLISYFRYERLFKS
ncbi:MAG: hypothetical protein Q7J54_03690 [Candidatus Woesearchaeota archaeon]|nr:hypothetical protein [Candidatus Woesearchaeota archaeon]